MNIVGGYLAPVWCDCGPVRRLVEHADGLEAAKKAETDLAFNPATLDLIVEQLCDASGISESDARAVATEKHGDFLKLVAEQLDAFDDEIATSQSVCEKLTAECPGRMRVQQTDALGRRVVLYVCSSPLIDALDGSGVEPVVVERIN
jgi:hypothetical protein